MRFAQIGRSGPQLGAVRWATTVLLACMLAVAGDRAPVREKVRFSSPDDPVDSPATRPQEDLLSRPFEFLERGNSISGVVEPLVAPASSALPNYARSARLLEAFDHKKNWVYLRSDNVNRAQTMDELFGPRDSARADKRPRTALEDFFEDRGPKPARDRTREAPGRWNRIDAKKDFGSSFDRDAWKGEDPNSRFDNPFDSKRTLTAGFSPPGDFFGASQRQGWLDSFRNGGSGDLFSSTRDRESRSDEFRKLLAVPGSASPLTPGFDPINLQLDTTRQQLNPVTALRLGQLPGASGDALNALRSVEPTGNRSSLLDVQNASTLGPSSLSPAVSAPTQTPYLQPKPAVLEFPRRKF